MNLINQNNKSIHKFLSSLCLIAHRRDYLFRNCLNPTFSTQTTNCKVRADGYLVDTNRLSGSAWKSEGRENVRGEGASGETSRTSPDWMESWTTHSRGKLWVSRTF